MMEPLQSRSIVYSQFLNGMAHYEDENALAWSNQYRTIRDGEYQFCIVFPNAFFTTDPREDPVHLGSVNEVAMRRQVKQPVRASLDYFNECDDRDFNPPCMFSFYDARKCLIRLVEGRNPMQALAIYIGHIVEAAQMGYILDRTILMVDLSCIRSATHGYLAIEPRSNSGDVRVRNWWDWKARLCKYGHPLTGYPFGQECIAFPVSFPMLPQYANEHEMKGEFEDFSLPEDFYIHWPGLTEFGRKWCSTEDKIDFDEHTVDLPE